MTNHPHLKALYTLYQFENHPFRKVHRMIDLFESLIKTHTLVIIGEYFKRNQLSDSAKGLLAVGLRTPSLGTWQLFSRELYKELIIANHVFLSDTFPKEFEDLDKALNNQKTNVISFRNGYAHGATPSDADCVKDINQFEPFLERLLASTWIANTDIIEKEGKAILISLQNNDELSLHPLLIAKSEKDAQPFAFFNDLKDDKVGLLNYPLSKHYREKEFFSEFNSYLPLKEWKKNGNQQFKKNIEELTETFKGREIELKTIKEFISNNNKGFLCITGNPGIGKSSLIAQAFKEINTAENNENYFLIEYFIKRGTAQARPDFLINYLQRVLADRIKKMISPLGPSIEEKGDAIIENLKIWTAENPNQKLILLIDGLDEGVENGLLDFMPRQLFEGVLIIYGSRPGGDENLTKFWMELSTEKKKFLELKGLNSNDIRALLYEVSNKYALEQNWIDTIAKKSEGNPLYLKLLCETIEAGETDINDENALPSDIGRYYDNFLNRYSKMAEGDHILQALYVIAAAHDYLSVHHIELILGIGEVESMRIMSILSEVLYDNPFTIEIEDWQLFHESFREYLKLNRASKIQDAEQKIIKYCSLWDTLNGKWEQNYCMMHYSKHLLNAIEKDIIQPQELYTLADNDNYRRQQIKSTKIYTHTFELIKTARNLACLKEETNTAIHFLVERLKEMFKETNTLPEMVNLVRQGDIDTALIRTKDWREDRKLINYLLFIEELLFGKSKTTEFKNEAIKSVLLAIEEMPIYKDMFYWNDFIPPIAVYRFDLELRRLNLSAKVIWQRTRNWGYSDFDDIISYNEFYSREYSHLIWADIYNIMDELDTEGFASSLAGVLLDLKIELSFIENVNNKNNLNYIIKALDDEKLKFQSDSSYSNDILISEETILNSEIKTLVSEFKTNTLTKLEVENIINLLYKELEKINLLETKFESGLEILKELAPINQKDYCNSFIDLLITCAEAFEVKSIEFSSNNDVTYAKYTKDDALFLVLKLCIEYNFENYFKTLLNKQIGIFNVEALHLIAQNQILKNDYEDAYKYLVDSISYLEDNFDLFFNSLGLLDDCFHEAQTKIGMSFFEIGKLKDAVRIARLNSAQDSKFKMMFAQCVRKNNWTSYSNLHFEIFNYKDKISEQMGHNEYNWWNSKEYVEEILFNLLNSDKKEKALLQLKKIIEKYENKGFDITFYTNKLKEIITEQNDSELALSIIEVVNKSNNINLLYDFNLEILSKFQDNNYSDKFKKLYAEEFNKYFNSKDAYNIINASETLREIGKFEDSLKLLNRVKQLELTTYNKEIIYKELIAHDDIEDAKTFLIENDDIKEKFSISYPEKYNISEEKLKINNYNFSDIELLNEDQKTKLVNDLCSKGQILFDDNKIDFSIKVLNLALSVKPKEEDIKKIALNFINTDNIQNCNEIISKIDSFSIKEAIIIKIIESFIIKEDDFNAKSYFNLLIDSYNSTNFIESDIGVNTGEFWLLASQEHFEKLDSFKTDYDDDQLIEYQLYKGLIFAIMGEIEKSIKTLNEGLYKIIDIGERNDRIKDISNFFMNELKRRDFALEWMKNFSEPVDINLCLTGILMKTDVSEIDSKFLLEYLPFAYTNNLITLLFKHTAWQCIYAVNPDRKIISEIESVLDISHYTCFLDDIKSKSSDNINEWINEVSDEDDREQILLWAKQVSKGKLSEQDFLNHIKQFLNNT